MKILSSLLFIFSLAVVTVNATIIEVPGDYPEIQLAIDASSSGDTILVHPDTYVENINFRGKNLFLTSLYYMEKDTSYISSTIIDGSNPVYPDTGSCVIFCSGEDSTAVLQGFTLTGGTGTKWLDIHGAGTYREGGGILVELSSPMILHNIITQNACTDLTGVVSTGGGGIRVGDGNPIIANNRITYNEARYGAGIVLNYTGATITNNIIASNTGGQEFTGGSGIWILQNNGTLPKVITNNTIVNNVSQLASGTGGVFIWWGGNVFLRNNIIYGNIPDVQLKVTMANPVVSFNDIEGGYNGVGNIDENPQFESQSYFLSDTSPCIDAGDTAAVYLDIEDPGTPGSALFPSKGGLRNDIGAYGGPGSALLPSFGTIYVRVDEIGHEVEDLMVSPNPSNGMITVVGQGELVVNNILGELLYAAALHEGNNRLELNLPDGLYFFRLVENGRIRLARVVINK